MVKKPRRILVKAFAAALAISVLIASSANANPDLLLKPAVCGNGATFSEFTFNRPLDRPVGIFGTSKCFQFTLPKVDGTGSRKAGYEAVLKGLNWREATWHSLSFNFQVPEGQVAGNDNKITSSNLIITFHLNNNQFLQKSFKDLGITLTPGKWQRLEVDVKKLGGFGQGELMDRVVINVLGSNDAFRVNFGDIVVRHGNEGDPKGWLLLKGGCAVLN